MIYDQTGRRKYLTTNERQSFIDCSQRLRPEVATFCLTLVYTGARISEVLALTPERIDQESGVIVFESLKKRRRGVYRAVPVPESFLRQLVTVHNITEVGPDLARRAIRIWPWCRTSAWSLVKRTMLTAGIDSYRSMPRALRHAFAVGAVQRQVPLNILQKWLGHSRITTTAIYAEAVGDEERALAQRMWSPNS